MLCRPYSSGGLIVALRFSAFAIFGVRGESPKRQSRTKLARRQKVPKIYFRDDETGLLMRPLRFRMQMGTVSVRKQQDPDGTYRCIGFTVSMADTKSFTPAGKVRRVPLVLSTFNCLSWASQKRSCRLSWKNTRSSRERREGWHKTTWDNPRCEQNE